MTDATFKPAFQEYLTDPAAATTKYGPIEGWDASNVPMMDNLMSTSPAGTYPIMYNPSAGTFNANISAWNTSSVVSMARMFAGATSFNQSIGGFNTAAVVDMSSMFSGASAFDQPIGNWSTASVTDMSFMFSYAAAFDQPIGAWNTSSVTDMHMMFNNAAAFDQWIGAWNTASVVDMIMMFFRAAAFDQPIGEWNATAYMSSMFVGAKMGNCSKSSIGRSAGFASPFPSSTSEDAVRAAAEKKAWAELPVCTTTTTTTATTTTDTTTTAMTMTNTTTTTTATTMTTTTTTTTTTAWMCCCPRSYYVSPKDAHKLSWEQPDGVICPFHAAATEVCPSSSSVLAGRPAAQSRWLPRGGHGKYFHLEPRRICGHGEGDCGMAKQKADHKKTCSRMPPVPRLADNGWVNECPGFNRHGHELAAKHPSDTPKHLLLEDYPGGKTVCDGCVPCDSGETSDNWVAPTTSTMPTIVQPAVGDFLGNVQTYGTTDCSGTPTRRLTNKDGRIAAGDGKQLNDTKQIDVSGTCTLSDDGSDGSTAWNPETWDRVVSSTGDECTSTSRLAVYAEHADKATCKAATTPLITLQFDGLCHQNTLGLFGQAISCRAKCCIQCASATVVASFAGVAIALVMATVV